MGRQLTLDEWLKLQERRELERDLEWLRQMGNYLIENAATINKGIPGVHRIDPEEWFVVY